MGRRPTIQTTVTASLTKSSLGACSQMLPVKFASEFCVFVTLKCVKKQKNAFKRKSHLRCLQQYPASHFSYIYPFIYHRLSSRVLQCRSRRSQLG